jgi:hypothetical protein
MSKPQVGGYEFNQELNRIQTAANEINKSLSKLLENNLGPSATLAHIAKMAVQIGIILDGISKIGKIGEQTRDVRTTPRKRS